MKSIVVNYSERTITLSSAFAKKAFTHGTAEYAQLMAVRSDFPEFRLVTRQFKTNTKQDRYKGLSYPYMRWYIKQVEGENAPAVLDGFEALLAMSKCHSAGRRYKYVKEWFFKRYPDVKKFGMTEKELAKFEAAQKEKAAATAPTSDAPAPQTSDLAQHPASTEAEGEPLANAS